jgi:integrase
MTTSVARCRAECYNPRMGDWSRVAENLVRHRAGTYYLRAKVGGKVIRESLRTRDMTTAKLRRDARLADLRRTAARPGATIAFRSMGDVVTALDATLSTTPGLAAKTRAYNRDVVRILRATMPLDALARTWSAADARAWWATVANRYSPSVANKLLAAARHMSSLMIESGTRADNPTRDLKRVRGRTAALAVPSAGDMVRVIDSIRTCGKRMAVESAAFVAVAAFSGLRKGEMRALRWQDVGDEWLTVGADGQTKSRTFRRVPISEPLRAAFAGIRAQFTARRLPVPARGPVFHMASPRKALHSACAACGLPAMRVHDLRHFFATWCIESGVDVPTVAKWLGHKDGGALAMRTYGHVRDDHGIRAAAKLTLRP